MTRIVSVLLGFALMGVLALPLVAQTSPAEEREIALWILREGGQLMIDGVEESIADPFDLPDSQ